MKILNSSDRWLPRLPKVKEKEATSVPPVSFRRLPPTRRLPSFDTSLIEKRAAVPDQDANSVAHKGSKKFPAWMKRRTCEDDLPDLLANVGKL
jgi:hypothetical protein